MQRLKISSFIICLSFLLFGCGSDASLEASSNTNTSIAKLSTNKQEIIGIDVSKHQGKVDFTKVKEAGIRYMFIRATDGVTYQDPNFKKNYAQAQAAGISVGAYHFYETNDAPSDQLKNFTSFVNLNPGDLPPVVDIEKLHKKDDVKLSDNLQKFLDGLESHYGVKPIIYTGLNFSNEYLTGFGSYPLWIAEYKRKSVTLPNGWDKWTFWQWSQTHKISGIDVDVDADRYNGDESSFRKMLIK